MLLQEYVDRKYRTEKRPSPELNLIKDNVAIVGVGQTAYTKDSQRDELDMACEAIKAAVDDAGLKMEDIDGFETFTIDRLALPMLVNALGVPNVRFSSEISGGGGAGASVAMHAAAAVATGQANYVCCYRSLNEASGQRYGRGDSYAEYMLTAFTPHYGYHWPFGFVTPLAWAGMWGKRWMYEFDITREQLGWWAVVLREYAQNNPDAIYYGRPITLDDYMESPMIVDPLKLHDCCVDTDGAAAYIITTVERARDLKQKPAIFLAASQSSPIEQEIQTVYNRPIMSGLVETWYMGQELYHMAGVGPDDIDVAQLYDPYSIGGVIQLEELGFCERGDGGKFIEGGDNIRVDGKIPCNTSGGLLSECYLHGWNLVIEGVRQIRGTSYNQVKDVELSMVTGGPGVPSSGIILRR
ncbi:MAG: lipid-transfer protein [Dehalococcoidia bacterium]